MIYVYRTWRCRTLWRCSMHRRIAGDWLDPGKKERRISAKDIDLGSESGRKDGKGSQEKGMEGGQETLQDFLATWYLMGEYKSGGGGGGSGGPVIYNAITLVFTAVSNQGDNLVTNQCFASRAWPRPALTPYSRYICMYIVYVYIYIGGPSSGLYESRMFMFLAAAPQNLANIGSQFNDHPVLSTLPTSFDPRAR